MELSVVICTYNGAQRLPQVLTRLQQQQQPNCDWEVLVVDNNSGDRTAEIIRTFQSSWPLEVPLRYSFEPRQGLAFARRAPFKTPTVR